MKLKVLLVLLFSVAQGAPNAEFCKIENCDISDNCVCSSTISPLPLEDTPQFVVLTFDDVVRQDIYQMYYEPILFHRTNPDGNPISATFLVPHDYTNYTIVNTLYNRGFEIGVNSITKNPQASYWAKAEVEELVGEFQGGKEIVHLFANIPLEDIKGARIPNLQLAGDKTFEALMLSGLSYDNSWPTASWEPLFPYTLDYLSGQECWVGKCPTSSFPGMFVSPIINFKSQAHVECNTLYGCLVSGTVEDIFDWLKSQFEEIYTYNKAPQTYNVNSVWFATNENATAAYTQFLDYLGTLPDVYLVSHSDVQAWMLNPVKVSSYTNPAKERNAECNSFNCYNLPFGEGQSRVMGSCIPCPAVYPWLGNPSGSS